MTEPALPQIFPVSMVDKPFAYPVKNPDGSGSVAVGVPLAAVPENWRLQSLKPFIEEYRHKPDRRRGNAKMTEKSFVDYVNRFKNHDHTVLFIRRRWWWWKVTAVFDFHPAGAGIEDAGNCTFRCWCTVRRYDEILKRLQLTVFYGDEP